jgi:glutathione S-transferase
MLEEVGADYENIPVKDLRSPEFLRLNPNGRVPVLVDDELVLWESLAINLYLARRFPTGLSPRSLSEEGEALKWSFWAESQMEAILNGIASIEAVPVEWRDRTLDTLDTALAPTGHLVGGRFTVADLNVANMFNGPVSARLDLSAHPSIEQWLSSSRARPAAEIVFRRAAEALGASHTT